MQKNKTFRCKNYIEYVRDQNCRVTMRENPDVHHIKGVLPASYGGKISDIFTIGLCHELHQELHSGGIKEWESKHTLQATECLKLINRALEQGLIEIKWIGG